MQFSLNQTTGMETVLSDTTTPFARGVCSLPQEVAKKNGRLTSSTPSICKKRHGMPQMNYGDADFKISRL